jgi:putative chitinase
MDANDKAKLTLTGVVLTSLVGLVLLAGHFPAVQQLYLQVSGSLLGLLGLHHGHDILSNGIGSGSSAPDAPEAPQEAPQADQVPTAVGLVTVEQLQAIMPRAGPILCRNNIDAINTACQKWGINTPTRMAMFLGNCALECDELRETEEHWVPTQAQLDYEPPHHVAAVLGNTQKGDGVKYRGRGVIQLTGRSNYRMAGHAISQDLENFPELAAQIEHAWRVAGWFWETHGLNLIADTGDFQGTVQRINGGLTDLAERQTYYERARKALGA